MTAIDTNVLVDMLDAAADASTAAFRTIERTAAAGALLVSPVVYAELRAHPRGTREDVAAFFDALRVRVDWSLEREVWVAAGDAFALYAHRRRSSGGGEPRRLLADFVIGAHAAHSAGRLVTRDVAFYRRTFPELRVIEVAAA